MFPELPPLPSVEISVRGITVTGRAPTIAVEMAIAAALAVPRARTPAEASTKKHRAMAAEYPRLVQPACLAYAIGMPEEGGEGPPSLDAPAERWAKYARRFESTFTPLEQKSINVQLSRSIMDDSAVARIFGTVDDEGNEATPGNSSGPSDAMSADGP